MKTWIRRIRGAIGLGLTWAVGWMPIGAITALFLWAISFDSPGLVTFALVNATLFGALGFVGGSTFFVILRLAEGRRSFDELKLRRFAAWGGVAGLLLGGFAGILGRFAGITLFGGPGLQVMDVVVLSVTTLLGAGSAAGTLWLARKAEPRLVAGERSTVRGGP